VKSAQLPVFFLVLIQKIELVFIELPEKFVPGNLLKLLFAFTGLRKMYPDYAHVVPVSGPFYFCRDAIPFLRPLLDQLVVMCLIRLCHNLYWFKVP
jgi:hypothetical protein